MSLIAGFLVTSIDKKYRFIAFILFSLVLEFIKINNKGDKYYELSSL
jgi:hypothetical protein